MHPRTVLAKYLLPGSSRISTDPYYTLRLAKKSKSSQTISNCDFWLTGPIHSGTIFHANEFGSLISQIVSALRKIKDVLLIISSRFGHQQMVVPTFPRLIEIRTKKEFDETKLNLSIYNNSKMKKAALTENEVNGVTG